MKSVFKGLEHLLVDEFSPFWFAQVVGTGICSTILHSYQMPWLLWCSYIMFSIASLLLILTLALMLTNMTRTVRKTGLRQYFAKYFDEPGNNVFWAFLPMGLGTLTNFLSQLCNHELKDSRRSRRLSIAVYSLWCLNTVISFATAWGVKFLLWRSREEKEVFNQDKLGQRNSGEALKPPHLLPIIPLLVVSSSSGLFTMSASFAHFADRKIQLSILIATSLIWLHAIFLAFFIICACVWGFYINRFPPGKLAFTMFLIIGPLGQASFGILLLTDNIKRYIMLYLPITHKESVNAHIGNLIAAMSFKTLGFAAGLALISLGIFFTVMAFAAILSSSRETPPDERKFKMVTFHKGWWAMPFPLGTMAVANKEFSRQYTPQIGGRVFEMIGIIYAVLCTTAVVTCMMGSIYIFCTAWKTIILEDQKNRLAKGVSIDRSHKLDV